MTDEKARTFMAGMLTFRRTSPPSNTIPGQWEATPADPVNLQTHWVGVGPIECILADRVVHLEDTLASKKIDPEGLELSPACHEPPGTGVSPSIDDSGDFRHHSVPDGSPELSSQDEWDNAWWCTTCRKHVKNDEKEIIAGDAICPSCMGHLNVGLVLEIRRMIAERSTQLNELPDGYQYVEWETCDKKSSKIHITGPRVFDYGTICGQTIGEPATSVLHSTDRDRVCHLCHRSLLKRQRNGEFK